MAAGITRIGGIKLSGELVQVDCRVNGTSDEKLTDLLQAITVAKINIPHLHQGLFGAVMQTTFCVDVDDFHHLKPVMEEKLQQLWFRIIPSVGTLTIFPHGSSIGFVARVFGFFAEEGFPVHGVSTSVSALVIHTDYALLNRAVNTVLTFCELPQDHTPFRPEFKMQQIER